MKVRLATLLPGDVALSVGLNGARRGFARVESGEDLPVVVKQASPGVLAAEIFCSVLARALGLPVPEPLVVYDPSVQSIIFGCIDAKYPNLQQHFALKNNPSMEEIALVAERLFRWTRLPELACFDEWVWNVDRNLQNLLWDGENEFRPIDHGNCLGLHSASMPDVNKLLRILLAPIENRQPEIQRLRKKILEGAIAFEVEAVREASDAVSHIPDYNASTMSGKFLTFTTERLPRLAGLVSKRFPTPQLGFDFTGGIDIHG